MKVKELKNLLEYLDDDVNIYIYDLTSGIRCELLEIDDTTENQEYYDINIKVI